MSLIYYTDNSEPYIYSIFPSKVPTSEKIFGTYFFIDIIFHIMRKICLLMMIDRPSYAVGDACYGGIVGITYSVSRNPLLSWKVSEQPLVGIVINTPPILQCTDSNNRHPFNISKK